MIPEIGHYALILALCVAVVQGTLPIYGAAVGNSALMAVAKPAARGQFLLVLLAFGCLGYAFAEKDFSVLYVAATLNSQLPLSIALRPFGARTRARCSSGCSSSLSGWSRFRSSPPICRRRCARVFWA